MKRLVIRVLFVPAFPLYLFVYLFLFQPAWLIGSLQQASPDVLFSVATTEKVVALSIDDGPSATTTAELLTLLALHDSHATFFILSDNIQGNETLVEAMVQQGHEIDNHSTVDEASVSLSAADFEQKLMWANQTLAPYQQPGWFRPGSGVYDGEMLEILHEHGYRCALGSVHPLDPQIPSERFATWYLLEHIQPGDIIILHDGPERGQRTINVLATVLPQLERQGYEVVTISELVARAP